MKNKWAMASIALVAVFGIVWRFGGNAVPPEQPVESPPPVEQADDEEGAPFDLFADPNDEPEPIDAPAVRDSDRSRRGERAERRARWRERMANMTPEQRKKFREERRARWRERMKDNITIEAIGDAQPTIEAADVMDGLSDNRRTMRDCLRNNGGWEAFREAMRGAQRVDAGAGRGSRQVAFDLDVNGAVVPGTVELKPHVPEPWGSCFVQGFQKTEFAMPGTETRVEVKFPQRGRRGRR